MFAAIPLMVYAAGSYFQKANEKTNSMLPQYSVFGNFSVLSFEEMLMTVFNFMVIILAALIVTDEYRSGQLRMVMLRAYTFGKLFWAKGAVFTTLLLMFTCFYFICSYIAGFFMFPHAERFPLFYRSEMVDVWEGLVYNLAFYSLGFLSLLALVCVMLFISVVSHTTTATIGIGLGFYLFSLMYPYVCGYFQPLLGNEVYMKIIFSSIPMIQWQGIVFMLAEQPRYVGWIVGVLSFYSLAFGGAAYALFTRKDRWI
ncbi:hypothetical protein AMI01nite_18590 [Aneurinibacillus migulanus]|nr:hypothetical protein AMI01nite_18590 [Aneurinibacillus migulanus]